MSQYVLTPAAAADIEEIAAYIAEQSPEMALQVIRHIRAFMQRLAQGPGIGHKHDRLADESLRVWVVYSYLIVYRPATRPVEILRVVHGSRDLARRFSS